jgi:hypothetical protein
MYYATQTVFRPLQDEAVEQVLFVKPFDGFGSFKFPNILLGEAVCEISFDT